MKIGTDIVEIERIKKLIDKYDTKFLNKIFTREEQQYCEQGLNRYQRYAGRFAAKEAIRKALQPYSDEQYLPFRQIHILPDVAGVPIPRITTDIEFTRQYGEISLSISHERHYAIACVIIN